MIKASLCIFALAATVAALDPPASGGTKGLVRLLLIAEDASSAMALQPWARALGQAGIADVQLRSGDGTTRVGIEVRQTPAGPLYLVTGLVRSRDELVLPSGRFRRAEVGRLAQWLDDLARLGPEGQREEKLPFGLTRTQYERVQRDLARPVGFSTEEMPRDEAVRRIAPRLQLPLQLEPSHMRVLQGDRIGEQLSGISCGTALAYVLRPAGLCLIPRSLQGQLTYVVARAKPGLDIWPVGWVPKKRRAEVLPALLGFHMVSIRGVSTARALEEFARLLKVPILLDHNALARWGIDPTQVKVSHPQRRTTYEEALARILFQAQLQSEVRLDEAGKPFLWITTLKPL